MRQALLRSLAAVSLGAALTGCTSAPGYPRPAAAGKPGAETPRPDQQLDFATLYQKNCAGCHGEDGRGGAALALNNPAYLAIAGPVNIRSAIARGMPGTLMPAFSQHSGGLLTDAQVDALVQGMIHTWKIPSSIDGATLPPYAVSAGNAANGAAAYQTACARCHGVIGTGTPAAGHSVVDPSYLALIGDQSLRSIVLAAHPEPSTHDWRKYIAGPNARALTSQEVDDIVAWLAQHRTPASSTSAAPAATEKTKP